MSRASGGSVPPPPDDLDRIPVILSPGAIYCDRCDWGHEGGTEAEQWAALVEHSRRDHP